MRGGSESTRAHDCILVLFPQNNKIAGLIEFGPSLLQLSMHILSCQLQITHAAHSRSKITLNRVKWDKIKGGFIVGAWIGIPRRETKAENVCPVHLYTLTGADSFWQYIKLNCPYDCQWIEIYWVPTVYWEQRCW